MADRPGRLGNRRSWRYRLRSEPWAESAAVGCDSVDLPSRIHRTIWNEEEWVCYVRKLWGRKGVVKALLVFLNFANATSLVSQSFRWIVAAQFLDKGTGIAGDVSRELDSVNSL